MKNTLHPPPLCLLATDWKDPPCRRSTDNWTQGLSPEWGFYLVNPQHFVFTNHVAPSHVRLFPFTFYHFIMFCLLDLVLSSLRAIIHIRIMHRYVLNELNLDVSNDSWNLEIFIEQHLSISQLWMLFIFWGKEVLIWITSLLLISLLENSGKFIQLTNLLSPC